MTSTSSGYDYIVCGAGAAGCAVASRLSEDPAVQVLLIEAGPDNDELKFTSLDQWFAALRGVDWGYVATPTDHLNGRAARMPMGKALGGGSAVNNMVWARGHQKDFEFWEAAAQSSEWGYPSVLATYKKIENWRGKPDPGRRGTGGPMWIEPPQDPSPLALAMLDAARSVGIPTFDDHNGSLMEQGEGGCALANLTIRNGRRYGVAHAYLGEARSRSNLHLRVHTEVRRIVMQGPRAVGVEISHEGMLSVLRAEAEVILSLGSIQTPHVLMRSGIGDAQAIGSAGIKPAHHLPGVGQNFQDHVLLLTCLWESPVAVPIRNNAHEATLFWKSDPALDIPDLQPFLFERPFATDANVATYGCPPNAWGIAPGLARPKSRGSLRLVADGSDTKVQVDAGFLSEPQDVSALTRCIEIIREMGSGKAFSRFVQREVMPGPAKGQELMNFIRNGSGSYGHATGTCAMGNGELAVVDARLRVRGIDRLRIADGSIMPRITTGNTMAPIVMIGEKLAQFLKDEAAGAGTR